MLVQSLALATAKLPGVFPYFLRVSGPQAGALREGLAHTPSDAEVISSWGVMGRFSERQWVYPLYQGVEADPIREPTVVFVLTNAGDEDDTPATVAAIARYVETDLKARAIVKSHGVAIFISHPPPGIHQVPIPNISP